MSDTDYGQPLANQVIKEIHNHDISPFGAYRLIETLTPFLGEVEQRELREYIAARILEETVKQPIYNPSHEKYVKRLHTLMKVLGHEQPGDEP